MTRFSNFLNRK